MSTNRNTLDFADVKQRWRPDRGGRRGSGLHLSRSAKPTASTGSGFDLSKSRYAVYSLCSRAVWLYLAALTHVPLFKIKG
jgi:hypothetical protein